MAYHLNIYAAMSFIAVAANLVFAIFVLFKNPSGRVNQLWSLAILSLVYWGSAEFFLRIIHDPILADTVVNLGGIGFCILPALFFHFTFEFTQQPHTSHRLIHVMYGIGVIICSLQLAGYITKPVLLPWGYTFTPAVLYTVFIVWLEVCFTIGIWWCWKKLRAASTKREVTQTLMIILGAVVPLTIGSTTDAFLPMAGFEVFRVAVVTTTVTVMLVSIGVVKYQLMSLTPETTASIILETMGDLVAVADMSGTLRFTNRAFRQTLGFEGLSARVEDFFAGNIKRDDLTANRVLHFETNYQCKDGRTFPVLLAVSNIFDKHESVGTIYVASDISSRVETEKKLRESEAMFRALSEAAPAAIFLYDKEKFLYVNKATEEITGFTKAELMTMKFQQLIDTQMRDSIQQRAEARLRGEDVPSHYEMRIQRNNGGIRWLNFAAAKIEINGNAAGVGLAFDVTERKDAEEQIREQLELLNKANDAIVVFTLKGKIKYYNAAAERLFHWDVTTVAEKSIAEMIPTVNYETFDRAFKILIEKNEWVGEIKIHTPNGNPMDLQSRWTIIRGDAGKPESVMMISSDITEKKMIEQQFYRSQRLESIGSLVSGIAHDLNNILAPVMMGIERLRRRTDIDKNKILDYMDVSTRRGVSLVKQVLTFAKGMEQERSTIDPKLLLMEIENIINETFPKSITVKTSVPKEINHIAGDVTQLHQVFLNLCINARDALPDGGTISISAKNVSDNAVVCISVTDTGTGMSEDVKRKIFDPFFTTKGSGKGTGLGLSTVQSIIKAHGGHIDVESILGAGTTFNIFIPAAPEEPEVQKSKTSVAYSYGNEELILVADDELSIVELTKETLETHHYKVMTAMNGKEAVELVKKNPSVACVIIDLNMPVLDGPAAIKEIQQTNADIPIIATSGNSPTYQDFKPQEFGVSGFLQKPFSLHALLKLLSEILASSRRNPQSTHMKTAH
ncbi:MAG: PAS domain S-box protein [Bacteroidota bacterium]|nr:PAS domain S-box protein [Bacteroidota bacterium]